MWHGMQYRHGQIISIVQSIHTVSIFWLWLLGSCHYENPHMSQHVHLTSDKGQSLNLYKCYHHPAVLDSRPYNKPDLSTCSLLILLDLCCLNSIQSLYILHPSSSSPLSSFHRPLNDWVPQEAPFFSKHLHRIAIFFS